MLFGVGPMDPLTTAGAVSILMITAIVASYFPVRRATRIDPVRCFALSDGRDPAVFVVVPLVLSAVALTAVWLPARRAARVDPRPQQRQLSPSTEASRLGVHMLDARVRQHDRSRL